MITLGIETSCDETSCALLEDGDKLLSNVVSSSLEKHKPFGGIVPEIASRHALENIDVVFEEALRQGRKRLEDVDLISVTYGPGLIGSLLVGVSFAKALAFSRKIDLVGVNHLEAHLEANLIEHPRPKSSYLGLVVSGGHTLLVLCKETHYERLGSTVDDAVGEAYDKVAMLMGLGYPGGPLIDQLAEKGDPKRFRFTKPKLAHELDFSFSGIKTAVLHLLEKMGDEKKKKEEWPHLAAGFQHAVISWLVEGVRRAAKKTGARHLLVGGGVSANSLLRKKLKELETELEMTVYLPPLNLTNDNAAMIAKTGYEKFQKGIRSDFSLTAMPNLPVLT